MYCLSYLICQVSNTFYFSFQLNFDYVLRAELCTQLKKKKKQQLAILKLLLEFKKMLSCHQSLLKYNLTTCKTEKTIHAHRFVEKCCVISFSNITIIQNTKSL